MSKKNGFIDQEDAKRALESLEVSTKPVIPVVNTDEIVLEVIPVKIRHYKEEPLTDDDESL